METKTGKMDTVRTSILTRVAALRKDKEANDVTFILGKDQSSRKILANSTILSMSSPYFRAMFHGPLKEQTSKHLPDVEPHVFDKLLDYVYGSDKCMDVESTEMAWNLKYAARQFLMPDLEQVADGYLARHLTFRNGLDFLKKATDYGADDIKSKVYETIKHHGEYILENGEVDLLLKEELVEIVQLFSDVSADVVFDAVLKWSKQLDGPDALATFLRSIFSLVKWERMSREYFCRNVYGKGFLSKELENAAMFDILSSSSSASSCASDDCDRAHYVLRLCVKFTSLHSAPPYFPPVERLFARTAEGEFTPNIGPSLTARMFSGEVCVEPNGMGRLKDLVASEDLVGYEVDETEVNVFYRTCGADAALFQVSNVSVRAYRLVMPTSRTSFLFEIRFDPIPIVPEQNDYYKGAITATVNFEVEIKRSLLLDLQEGLLMKKTLESPCAKRQANNRDGFNFRAKVLSWATYSGGYKLLSMDRSRYGVTAPLSKTAVPPLEYVKDSRREQVPFICQIN